MRAYCGHSWLPRLEYARYKGRFAGLIKGRFSVGDFETERNAMVDGQVRTSDVTDRRLQAALLAVPREKFMPRSKAALAYADSEVEVGEGRWLMRPRDFAKLVQAAEIKAGDIILDIGIGRGYSSAVLSRMGETVVGVESDGALVKRAERSLSETESDNAVVLKNDLKVGAPDQGPFDVIFVNGGVEEVSRSWFDQLADGGRLAVIVRKGPVGKAMIYTKSGAGVGERTIFDATPHRLPELNREPGFVF